MKSISHVVCIASFVLVFFQVGAQPGSATIRDSVEKPVEDSVRIRQQTQQHEEQWRTERQVLLRRFEELEQRRDHLQERKQSLTEENRKTTERITTKQRELEEIAQIQRAIEPLIETLIIDLEQSVASGLPFLAEERHQRLERLRATAGDPEISTSEKFRKAMEALFIEAEYGSTIEVYQETIELEDRHLLVTIFRLGRTALFFQTIDTATCGYFNPATRRWNRLPPEFNASVNTAMEIGSRRRPAELVELPLGRLQLP